MKPANALLLALLTLTVGAAYGLARFQASMNTQAQTTDPTVIITSGETHEVTPTMLAQANSMERDEAPTFQAEANNGKNYSLGELAAEGPLALIFIKDGCPCSIAAAPYYNRLNEAYGSHVRFFGIIDGDTEVARKWGHANEVTFPILCDPNLRIVRKYKAANSAYFTIISRGGTIEKYWPGYSVGMLTEANEQLARLSQLKVKAIDVTDAPDEMFSGCPY